MSWRARIQSRVGQLRLDVDISGDERPLALVGPNGSGKTSLLRMIAGALQPDHGEIEVNGELFYSSNRHVSLPTELRRVGYLPQGYVFPDTKVV